jgi:hypothetical protein
MCYFYENKTSNKKFEENLKFTLTALEIVGYPPNTEQVSVKLSPGESKFVELRALTNQWKISTAISYGIS